MKQFSTLWKLFLFGHYCSARFSEWLHENHQKSPFYLDSLKWYNKKASSKYRFTIAKKTKPDFRSRENSYYTQGDASLADSRTAVGIIRSDTCARVSSSSSLRVMLLFQYFVISDNMFRFVANTTE